MQRNIEIATSSRAAARREGIERLDRIAYWLDDLIRIPVLNKRIGLDPIIGMIPWAGDTVTVGLGVYIIASAIYYQTPKIVLVRMALNVAFDYLVGLVPFVGDVGDFLIKSNRRNLNLLRAYAHETKTPGIGDYLFVGMIILALLAVVAGGVLLAVLLLKYLADLGFNKLW